MIRSIDPLISLPARDLAHAHRFYSETLGMMATYENAEAGFYVYAGDREQKTMIGVHGCETPAPSEEAQNIWFWLHVDDIDLVRGSLEQQGVRFLGEKADLGPGMEQRFVDSEGNVLRFYERWRETLREVDIDAPATAVWDALTQASLIERWFATIDDVVVDARVGGTVSFTDPIFGRVVGRVTAFDAPRRLTIDFSENWPTYLEFTLVERSGSTHLQVRQHGFDAIADRDFGIPSLREKIDQGIRALVESVWSNRAGANATASWSPR